MRREDRNGEQRTQNTAPFRIKAGQRIQAQTCTGNVTQHEHQATAQHQHGQQVATARNSRIGQIGRAHFSQRHDAPDVQLNDEINQD